MKEIFIRPWGLMAIMGGTADLEGRHCRPAHNSDLQTVSMAIMVGYENELVKI